MLIDELARSYTKIPGFLVSGALKLVRSSIQKTGGFDVLKLNPIDHVEACFIPALFGHGIEDDFIKPHHSDDLHAKYAGDKNMIKFDGDHNSPRPEFFYNSATIFFFNTL